MQKNIDFGAFPDDPSSDAIRTAFQKVQENFTELYNYSLLTRGVDSINRIPQPGISVSSSTGNVLISANIAQVQIQTTSLALGINSPDDESYANLTNSSQTLFIDLKDDTIISNSLSIGTTAPNTFISEGNIITSANIQSGNINGGNLVTANFFTGVLTTNAQPNITSVGTLSNLSVTGNTTSGLFVGNGSALTNLTGANVTGFVPNAVHANTSTTVTDNSQPNITSVGTLTSLSVTGNVSSGNVSATNGAFTNISGNGANLTNITAANVNGFVPNAVHANTATTITANAQPNITSVGTLTSLTISGNTTSGNINGGNLVSANFLSGILTTADQPNISNIGTLGNLLVSGNITANILIANNSIQENIDGNLYPVVTQYDIGTDENQIPINQYLGELAFLDYLGTLGANNEITINNGNVGIGTIGPAYKLEVNGSFAATTKSFIIDHPTKPDYRLRYASLEGPENGVYIRGRSQSSIIELPEYWPNLVDETTISVTLTPVTIYQNLYVDEISNNTVIVKSAKSQVIDYFYVIYAERKDVDKLEIEVKK